MKRILCLILSAVMLLGMMGITASAEGTLKVKFAEVEAAPGETVEILVSLENNPGITGISGRVTYDRTALTFKGATGETDRGIWDNTGATLMYYYDGIIEDEETGEIIEWYDSYKGEKLVTLKFLVKEDAAPGKYDITFDMDPDSDTIVAADGSSITDHELVPGSITVTAPVTVEDGYYLIGSINEWKVENLNESYKFEANPSGNNEYMLNASLAVGDEIKVVKVENGSFATWYPDGDGNNYVVDEPHSGDVVVYFKPEYVEGWKDFGGYMWINGKLAPVELYGASVSLKGNIGLNFFLVPTDELLSDANSYVTLNGTKYLFKDAATRELDGKTLYQFSISLHAKQMNEKVEVKVFSGDERPAPIYRPKEDVTSATYQFSIQDYIQRTIEANGNGNEKLVALVKAMSDYGSLAQAALTYNTGDRAEVMADLNSVSAADLEPYAAKVTEGAASGVSYYGTSLQLQSETIMRIYFTLDEGEIGDYSFKLGKTAVTPAKDDNGWYVDVTNIAAKDLDKNFTVTVSSAAGKVLTVKTCALSYAYKVLTTEGAEAKYVDVVKGLYLYNKAANEYFG